MKLKNCQLVCDYNKWYDRMEESNNICSTCDKPKLN